MGFLFALLSYLATIGTAIVLIVASISLILPGPPPPRSATDVSAAKPQALSLKQATRLMAERAAERQ